MPKLCHGWYRFRTGTAHFFAGVAYPGSGKHARCGFSFEKIDPSAQIHANQGDVIAGECGMCRNLLARDAEWERAKIVKKRACQSCGIVLDDLATDHDQVVCALGLGGNQISHAIGSFLASLGSKLCQELEARRVGAALRHQQTMAKVNQLIAQLEQYCIEGAVVNRVFGPPDPTPAPGYRDCCHMRTDEDHSPNCPGGPRECCGVHPLNDHAPGCPEGAQPDPAA